MKRLLSGLRPTGKIHIGNLYGALSNWVKLQEEYRCFYEVADWHALTTAYQDTSNLRSLIKETVIDWISVGIDPEKSVLFVQSEVKEHAELHLLFSMLVTVSRLERNPTLKEMVRDMELQEQVSYGLLGYPVLQAADILIYRPDVVPIGEDQRAHLELTREIARRFNHLYGKVFPEPEPIFSSFPKVPGIDRRKMSKSYGNAIFVADEPDEIKKKVMQAFTDPEKIKKNDPGHPEGCVVFAYHQIFNPGVSELEKECKRGNIGCVACKKRCAELMAKALEPYREKRRELEREDIEGILREGARRARVVAGETMEMVREAMRLW
ncbi:tryptophan--tRNA ligase [bacterium]|mgnify:CR=1 FL=1|nr:MAG: tryptophan--tRNA ligase [bacterium]RKZ26754.1 MAG: tryptophan--tRNA ligase [bacterium]